MPQIENALDLKTWLEGLPGEVAVAFATRCALRVLPKLAGEFKNNTFLSANQVATDIVLPVFRSCLVAWVALEQKTHETRVAAWFAAYDIKWTPLSNRYENTVVNAVVRSANAAASAAVRASHPAIHAGNAGNAAYAARAVEAVVPIWKNIQHDSMLIEDGLSAQQLGRRALWTKPNEMFPLAHAQLQQLADSLKKIESDWSFWINWYEARLLGSCSQERLDAKSIETHIALIDYHDWAQGPAHLNDLIGRIITVGPDLKPFRARRSLMRNWNSERR